MTGQWSVDDRLKYVCSRYPVCTFSSDTLTDGGMMPEHSDKWQQCEGSYQWPADSFSLPPKAKP